MKTDYKLFDRVMIVDGRYANKRGYASGFIPPRSGSYPVLVTMDPQYRGPASIWLDARAIEPESEESKNVE